MQFWGSWKKSWQWILSSVLETCHNKKHNNFSSLPPCYKAQIWSQSFSVIPLQPMCFTHAQVSFPSFPFGVLVLSPGPKDFHVLPPRWHQIFPTDVLPRGWLLHTQWNVGEEGKWDRGLQNQTNNVSISNCNEWTFFFFNCSSWI